VFRGYKHEVDALGEKSNAEYAKAPRWRIIWDRELIFNIQGE